MADTDQDRPQSGVQQAAADSAADAVAGDGIRDNAEIDGKPRFRVLRRQGWRKAFRLEAIFWDTLENHTVDFRGSPAFQDWRALVGPFFAAPPAVEHFDLLSKSA